MSRKVPYTSARTILGFIHWLLHSVLVYHRFPSKGLSITTVRVQTTFPNIFCTARGEDFFKTFQYPEESLRGKSLPLEYLQLAKIQHKPGSQNRTRVYGLLPTHFSLLLSVKPGQKKGEILCSLDGAPTFRSSVSGSSWDMEFSCSPGCFCVCDCLGWTCSFFTSSTHSMPEEASAQMH